MEVNSVYEDGASRDVGELLVTLVARERNKETQAVTLSITDITKGLHEPGTA